MGTSSIYGGRVEICIQQSWTTVRDAYWNNEDASVLCRQLGFSPYGIHSTAAPILFDMYVKFH